MLSVAITDPLPLFRHGVAAALLDCHLVVQTPDTLLDWAAGREPSVIIQTLETAADWILLARLSALPNSFVLAVTPNADASESTRAFTLGAAAVLPRACSPDQLRDAVRMVLAGRTSMDLAVLRQLLSGNSAEGPSPEPTLEEAEWLRLLAQGTPVKELAEHVGYSERMMFRLLRDLYQKLGASGRVDAILKAKQRDWL